MSTVPAGPPAPRVHVVLATYHPPLRHLDEQLRSILNQRDVDLSVTIVDDGSPTSLVKEIRALARDPRVTVVTGERLGVFHNFERGLTLVPDDVEVLLLSDQDDVWYPEKATTLAAALAESPSLLMVHSDARVIDDEGRVLHASMFEAEARDVMHLDVDHLVLKNVVTGCTTAFRPELLATAMPFPRLGSQAPFHHDLWLALCAASLNGLATVRKPLQDYRQHGNNVMGLEVAVNRWKDPKRAVLDWRLRRLVAAVALGALDAGQLPSAGPAEVLRSWQGPLAWAHLLRLAARWGRRGDAQAPFALLMAVVGLGGLVTAPVEALRRPARGLRRVRLGLALLAHMARDPSARSRITARLHQEVVAAGMLPDASEPLPHAVRPLPAVPALQAAGSRTLQVLVPYLPEQGVFGGVATALRLAVELAHQGEDVQVVETDKTDDLDADRLRRMLVASLSVPADWVQHLRFTSAVHPEMPLSVGPDDVFVATAWWTAHRAHWTSQSVGQPDPSFVYLVQDYEPSFYGGSDAQALAQASYDLPCLPVVNCATLAAHLRKVTDLDVRDDLVLVPQVDVTSLAALPRTAGDGPLRVLFYGRPGVPRNLFETAVRGLALWVSQRPQSRGVEIVSAGEEHPPVDVGNGVVLRSLGQLSWQEYEAELASSHLGLSLMLSPHPSYPPLEMAAAGLVVVTNRHADKDLSTLTSRVVSCTTTSFDVARALGEAEALLTTLGADDGRAYDTAPLGRSLTDVAASLRTYLAGRAAPVR